MKANHPEDKTIINSLYMPFAEQKRAWKPNDDPNMPFSTAQYDLMVNTADEIVLINPNPDSNDMKAVSKALNERNHAMVDESSMVIALYPPNTFKGRDSRGGTAECMNYALRNNTPVLRMWNSSKTELISRCRTTLPMYEQACRTYEMNF